MLGAGMCVSPEAFPAADVSTKLRDLVRPLRKAHELVFM